jgi:hypothetical protein
MASKDWPDSRGHSSIGLVEGLETRESCPSLIQAVVPDPDNDCGSSGKAGAGYLQLCFFSSYSC